MEAPEVKSRKSICQILTGQLRQQLRPEQLGITRSTSGSDAGFEHQCPPARHAGKHPEHHGRTMALRRAGEGLGGHGQADVKQDRQPRFHRDQYGHHSEEAEQAAAAERRRLKEQERIDKATAEAETLEAAKEAYVTSETAPEGVELGGSPDTLEHSTISDEAKAEQAEAATDAGDEVSSTPSVSSDESSSSKEEVAE